MLTFGMYGNRTLLNVSARVAVFTGHRSGRLQRVPLRFVCSRFRSNMFEAAIDVHVLFGFSFSRVLPYETGRASGALRHDRRMGDMHLYWRSRTLSDGDEFAFTRW